MKTNEKGKRMKSEKRKELQKRRVQARTSSCDYKREDKKRVTATPKRTSWVP